MSLPIPSSPHFLFPFPVTTLTLCRHVDRSAHEAHGRGAPGAAATREVDGEAVRLPSDPRPVRTVGAGGGPVEPWQAREELGGCVLCLRCAGRGASGGVASLVSKPGVARPDWPCGFLCCLLRQSFLLPSACQLPACLCYTFFPFFPQACASASTTCSCSLWRTQSSTQRQPGFSVWQSLHHHLQRPQPQPRHDLATRPCPYPPPPPPPPPSRELCVCCMLVLDTVVCPWRAIARSRCSTCVVRAGVGWA